MWREGSADRGAGVHKDEEIGKRRYVARTVLVCEGGVVLRLSGEGE